MDKEKFVKVPTEIFEALMHASLTKTQMTVFLYIIRKTFGWNKYADMISISMAAKELGKHRRHIQAAFHDLEIMGMIQIDDKLSGRPSKVSINDPEYWDKPALESVQATCTKSGAGRGAPESVQGGARKEVQGGALESVQVPAPESVHTKDIYKDNIKTNIKTRDFVPDFRTAYTDEEIAQLEAEGWTL